MSKFLPNTAKVVAISSILFAGVMFAAPQLAIAAYDIPVGGVELEGFAWSGYASGASTAGVGWISTNCSNTGTCGTSNYAVTLENSGNLSGYAWASNVLHPVTGVSLGPGWISFDPAGPYPSGAGTLNDDARATGGSYTGNLNFGGWARFCAAAANPAACSGGTNPSSGGWDGWISLAGSASGGYGITMTPTGAANGPTNYAWGGPVVVGWVDFSPNGHAPVSYTTIPPVVTILTPVGPVPPGPVMITFDPIGGGGAPDSCTYFDGTTTNSITLNSPVTNSESFVVNPTTDTTYIITCVNSAGSDDDSVNVEFFTDLTLGAVNTTLGTINAIGDYDTVEFTFTVSGVPVGASNVPYTIDLDGASTINGTFDGSSAVGGVVTITETFINVPFSATPLGWTVVVDPTSAAQPNGSVYEGGGAAEINEQTGTLNLPAPPPTITIDVDSIVRTGAVAEVEIEVISVGESNCTVFGPGITGEPDASFTVLAGTTVNQTLNTSELSNRVVIAVECTVVGGSAVREGASIEVTPSFQEI